MGYYRGVSITVEWGSRKRQRLDRVAAEMRQQNARVVKIRATLRQRALPVFQAIAACDRKIAERGGGSHGN